ncbi:type I secretion system permease/ATPase [Caulobacter sp. KR2-114]|uniref:type I secretion system permease/ATPase n=1 Tax=Caulobacter sp. KR2-114 TaxID=3400912 RepID=UPI003C0E255E
MADRLSRPSSALSGPCRAALAAVRSSFIAAAGFSGAINLLMLSGSLFMLQVYDRVLPSRSLPTLWALLVLVAALYAAQGLLELIRSRLFARIGRHVDRSLGPLVFAGQIDAAKGTGRGASFRDLEQLRAFLSSAGPTAIFDLPWLPIYLLLMALLHPLLGLMGVVGAALLAVLTWLSEKSAGPAQRESSRLAAEANALAEQARRGAETVGPLGMAGVLGARWAERNLAAGAAVLAGADAAGFFGALSRFVRMALQSATLAAGAFLIVSGKATGGVMIASSVLLGRALAPVELAIAHWRSFVAARQAFGRLEAALTDMDASGSAAMAATERLALPAPSRTLVVEQLTVAAPGAARLLVQGVGFSLQAGEGLGVIGPSGAGKSTLLRGLVGVLPPHRGTVRLDSSTLDQWPRDVAGRFIGYLPQQVELFPGTVAQNIARFDPAPPEGAVLAAAAIAGVDSLVRALPDGFETEVGEGGQRLSAGQRQRIGLARALYGDPFLVVLDEPNAALDAEGEAALGRAMAQARGRGAIVIAAVHRPSGLAPLDKLLVLAGGAQQAFGPREDVLRRVLAAQAGAPSPAAPHLEVVS